MFVVRRGLRVPRKVDQASVVWLAPETLHQEDLAERLAEVDDPADALAILNERPTEGEYREYLGDELGDGPDGTTVMVPIYGDLLVWVDEAPDDEEDGTGHFVRYDGDEADYEPRRSA
jgi:hypothetical protein